MGLVLGKFGSNAASGGGSSKFDVMLESVQDKIVEIENYTTYLQEQKTCFQRKLLATSFGIFMLSLMTYFFAWPANNSERFIYSIVFILLPLGIMGLRKLLLWYYHKELGKSTGKLAALREEKQKLLEQVMDRESYKVAANLLRRFSDSSTAIVATGPTATPAHLCHQPGNQLDNPMSTPVIRQCAPTPPSNMQAAAAQGWVRRTPFPIMNLQGRTLFERFIDLIVGDGPSDRYGMICKHCYSHNGMAIKEEFDYIKFHCAFCGYINPARKVRPIGPLLPMRCKPIQPFSCQITQFAPEARSYTSFQGCTFAATPRTTSSDEASAMAVATNTNAAVGGEKVPTTDLNECEPTDNFEPKMVELLTTEDEAETKGIADDAESAEVYYDDDFAEEDDNKVEVVREPVGKQ